MFLCYSNFVQTFWCQFFHLINPFLTSLMENTIKEHSIFDNSFKIKGYSSQASGNGQPDENFGTTVTSRHNNRFNQSSTGSPGEYRIDSFKEISDKTRLAELFVFDPLSVLLSPMSVPFPNVEL